MKSVFYVILFSFFISCSSNNETNQTKKKTGKWESIKLSFAENFAIERSVADNKTFRVSVFNPFTNDTVTYVSAENKRTLVMMANNIGFLSALNLQDNIVGVSRFKYVYDSVLNSKIDADMINQVGDMVSINKELVYNISPDYIVSSGFQNTYADLIWLPSKVKALVTYEWLEKHPLATLEWIKLYGALYGEFEKSDAYFNQKRNSYEKLKSKNNFNKSILSGSLYGDVWYTPGGASYKSILYNDAKVNYAYSEDTTTGSISLSIEEILNNQKDADFWCASLDVNSIKELKKVNSIYSEFDCVKKGNVYISNQLVNHKNVNGFWELYQVRPDLYLNDIITMSNDSLETNLNFFKKLD